MIDNIHFKLEVRDQFVIIHVSHNNVILPSELMTLITPDAVKEGFAHKGVVLNGPMPLWLCGYLVHTYHHTRFVAINDTRFPGAVVVESHNPDYYIGQILNF